jgi:hypothetical protein
MTFRPATGSQILLTTVFASLLLLTLGIFFLILDHRYRERGPVHHVFRVSGALMLVLLIGSFNFRIRRYEIASGNLTIKIGLASKVFSLQGLENVRIEEKPFAGCRRDLGIGGFWSNYGQFSSQRWGKFLAYASDTSRGVLLIWPDKKLLVTPADAPLFVQSLRP